MNIMTKKKKYKFQVQLTVAKLTAVPFVNAVLFCKVHLLDGGKYVALSSCEEVRDHAVKWNTRLSFVAKMTAAASTGLLDQCVCRVSVRREVKGGRSYQKMGFADINLCEYAGGVDESRRYLLEGYDCRRRQDNSMLHVCVSATVLSGDLCFRTPAPSGGVLCARGDSHHPAVTAATTSAVLRPVGSYPANLQLKDVLGAQTVDDIGGESDTASVAAACDKDSPPLAVASSACYIGGETATSAASAGTTGTATVGVSGGCGGGTSAVAGAAVGHSRNSSSQSGYGSFNSQSQPSHSRQSSSSESAQQLKEASSGSCLSDYNSMERAQARKTTDSVVSSRFDATRVDAEAVIDDLLRSTDLNGDPNETAESSGLQLFVGRDGSTAFWSRDTASFEPVVICKR